MRAFRCYSVTALPAIEPTGRHGGHLHRTVAIVISCCPAEQTRHGKAPAHRFTRHTMMCGACPARAFFFAPGWFMAFASIHDLMMISGSRASSRSRQRECGGANRARQRIIAGMSGRTKEHRETRPSKLAIFFFVPGNFSRACWLNFQNVWWQVLPSFD